MRFALLCVGLAGVVFGGCSKPPGAENDRSLSPTPQANQSTDWAPEPLHQAHLPNGYRIHEKVMSGGEPEGDEAFQELKELGVKTIISVDGAKPDVDTAAKYGIRYVHIPFGYDGVPEEQGSELAKAVRDLPGPIYIHCHHGKHRSPAGAAVACVGAGLIEPENALIVLRTAGTSDHYRGLYQSAEHARRFEDGLLDALKANFPSSVPVPPIAESMVAIEHTHDHLKAIEEAGWKSPPEQPDLEPAHEALLLREHFTELLRTDEVKQKPERMQELLRDTETAAGDLESSLRNWSDAAQPIPAAVTDLFAHVTNNCATCHAKFRDNPRDEARNR